MKITLHGKRNQTKLNITREKLHNQNWKIKYHQSRKPEREQR
jgi:hypothetical protein